MAGQGAQLAILLSSQGSAVPAIKAHGTAIAGLGNPAKAAQNALGGLMGGLGNLATTAAGFAIGAGLLNLPGILMDAAKAAADDAASVAKLQQAVTNSGASWDSYAGQLGEVIDKGIALGFSDSATRDSLALLTAQTGSATEAQKRLGLAQDLSRGANIDLATASKLLGKVTDENVGVLGRYGISVKEGMDSTELFGLVQAKFGGQAETFAKSAAGGMAAFSLQMGELQESLGAIALPLLAAFGQVMNSVVVPALKEHVVPALEALGQAVANVLGPAMEIGRGLFLAFSSDAGAMGIVLDNVRVIFGDTVANAIEPFVNAFMVAIPKIKEFVSFLVGEVKRNFETFGKIVSQVLSGDIEGAFTTFLDRVKEIADLLVPILKEWGEKFVDWVVKMTPLLMAEIKVTGAKLLGWIGDQVPVITTKLGEWIVAFVEWIGIALPQMLDEFGTLTTTFIRSVGVAGDDVKDKVDVEWTDALVDWISTKAIPALVQALPQISAAIIKFSVTATWEINQAFVRLGLQAAQGVWEGIKEYGPQLFANIRTWLLGAIEAGKNAIGAHSPSDVTAEELGRPMAMGVRDGWFKELPQTIAAVEDGMGQIMEAARGALDQHERGGRGGMAALVEPLIEALEEARPALDQHERQLQALGRAATEVVTTAMPPFLHQLKDMEIAAGGLATTTMPLFLHQIKDLEIAAGEKAPTALATARTFAEALAGSKDSGLLFARDAATQLTFVMLQMRDEMPSIVSAIGDYISKLAEIPREVVTTITTIYRDVHESIGGGSQDDRSLDQHDRHSLMSFGMGSRGGMALAGAGGGSYRPVVNVYVGQRQLEDLYVETRETAGRRGRNL